MTAILAQWIASSTLRLTVLVILLLAVAGAIWQVHGWRVAARALPAVRAELEAERSCAEGSRCAGRLLALRQAGTVAVEAARRAAQEAAGEAQAKREAEIRVEAERLTAAASEARVKAQAWRRRYEAALVTDQACAAWSRQVVPCPIAP